MKAKILSAMLAVIVMCSSAYASLPSVMMLSTKTCPACAQMAKVLDQINRDYSGKIETSHIYLEDEPELAQEYHVRYVPVLVFKDSERNEIAQEIGYMPKDKVLKIFADNGIKIEGGE